MVVLSHIGYTDDVALAQAVPGIDVIVGGHPTPSWTSPWWWATPSSCRPTSTASTGFLKLVVDGGRIVDYEGRLLPTTADMPIDAAVAAPLADWQGQLSERRASSSAKRPWT